MHLAVMPHNAGVTQVVAAEDTSLITLTGRAFNRLRVHLVPQCLP